MASLLVHTQEPTFISLFSSISSFQHSFFMSSKLAFLWKVGFVLINQLTSPTQSVLPGTNAYTNSRATLYCTLGRQGRMPWPLFEFASLKPCEICNTQPSNHLNGFAMSNWASVYLAPWLPWLLRDKLLLEVMLRFICYATAMNETWNTIITNTLHVSGPMTLRFFRSIKFATHVECISYLFNTGISIAGFAESSQVFLIGIIKVWLIFLKLNFRQHCKGFVKHVNLYFVNLQV